MEIKDRLKSVLKRADKVNVIMLLGFFCMALLFLLPESEAVPVVSTDINATQEYTTELEHRLTQIVSSIDGVGRCNLMITLEGGVEYIYATEERVSVDISEDKNGEEYIRTQQSDDIQQSYILVDGGNGEENALIKQEVEPTIKGIAVVCEGGDSPVVQSIVTDVLTTMLDIPSNKVFVTKLA